MMTDQLSETDTSCLCSRVSKLDTTSSGSRSSISTCGEESKKKQKSDKNQWSRLLTGL